MATEHPEMFVYGRSLQRHNTRRIGSIKLILKQGLSPYFVEIVSILMQKASNTDLRSCDEIQQCVTPKVLTVVGDIALSIGSEFQRCLQPVMGFMLKATEIQLDGSDILNRDYLRALRERIIHTYIGAIQGFKDLFRTHVLTSSGTS